ncbi:MAG TPA: YccF domain-containing protein [Dongiaceae bacterium]|jgi:uncharacterized membrane protein YccF (DUF307 family)|nr:YccF domain-containing protein [Dongiaceae bacterium]
MTLALNLLWLICGGFLMGCAWLVAALVMFVSIIGIPWGRAAFNIAVYTFFPFGNEAISRYELTGREDLGTGPLGLIGNVIWFVFAGIWLAIAHLAVGIACFITIIGIPFGWAHFKLVEISLAPIGKVIVSRDVAEEARRRHAAGMVDNLRR